MFNSYGHRESAFERNCKKVMGMFTKWKCREARTAYINTFSTKNWNKLSQSTKQRHTLSNREECAIQYTTQQHAFPGRVFTKRTDFATHVHMLVNEANSEHSTTRKILAALQPIYQQTYGHSFTQSLVQCPGTQLQVKPKDVDKKRKKREIQRECRDHMEAQFNKTDALTVLAEGISVQKYKRVRLSQSFERPEAKRARVEGQHPTNKKHSPNFEYVEWDKEKVLQDLREWPKNTIIYWSEFARNHNIPGQNNGQIVKEFAKANDIDVYELDHREPGKRTRSCKLRLPGGSISVPTHRTAEKINEDWSKMVANGELTLGEQCNACTITRYKAVDGELKAENSCLWQKNTTT